MPVTEHTPESMRAYIDKQYGDDAMPVVAQVNAWLRRGDGIAVYENHDLGHPDVGMCQLASFGSPTAMLEVETPPDRLPDIGSAINWRYLLVGTYRGGQLAGD